MRTNKQETIKRIDANTLKPKHPKPFNIEHFRQLAKAIKDAMRKEEEIYGKPNTNPSVS